VRWAAAEGVSETVIAAVLLLHERSVEEIAPHQRQTGSILQPNSPTAAATD
jgi:hypothetical protein